MRAVLSLILAALVTTGCAVKASNRAYSASALSTATRTVEGEIVSKRSVTVDSSRGGGAAGGAALGAIGGSGLGGDSTRGNLAGAVIGVMAGALAGAAIDSSASTIDAFEYIVHSDVAGLLTIVQADGEFTKGQKVFVVLGSKPVIVATQ